MATRRWGIAIDKDGNIHPGICRAKPGNEGTRGCHHFFHVANKKEAEDYVTLMATHRNDTNIVNYSADVNPIAERLRTYMMKHGDRNDLPDDPSQPILQSWFHNDQKKAKAIIDEAQSSKAIPVMKTTKTVKSDIQKLVSSGVKVEVTANRFTGLDTKRTSELDTDVWMTANDIPTKQYKGEAPVTLMVSDGAEEAHAAAKVRSKYVDEKPGVSNELHEDFMHNAGYVSLMRHRQSK